MTRLYPDAVTGPIYIVPTGVDTEFFRPIRYASARDTIVFTGSMDWLPNEDAMRYFCHQVLPHVRADEPGVRLSIVGRAPTPAVQASRGGRRRRHRPRGRCAAVPDEAAVYVVPLRIGGGTRLKIFEAMAMGKAVVSTTVGAEGLRLTDGDHLLIADDPRSFARAVVQLIRDRVDSRALGGRAQPGARAIRLVGRREAPSKSRCNRIALGQARSRSLGAACIPACIPPRSCRDGALEPAVMKSSLLGFSFKAGTDDLRESPLVSWPKALLVRVSRVR